MAAEGEPDLPRTGPELRAQRLGSALRNLAAELVDERRKVARLRREIAELTARLGPSSRRKTATKVVVYAPPRSAPACAPRRAALGSNNGSDPLLKTWPGKPTDVANPRAALPLLLAARGLAPALAAVWRDPETKALPFAAGALVLTGTILYWRFEDWTLVQALYLCVVTLATVGFGDLSPTTPGTQIFTIVYILTGFGVLVARLISVAQEYLRQKAEPGRVRARVSARRGRDAPVEDDGPQ